MVDGKLKTYHLHTNLPPPLLLNPSSHYHQHHHNQVHQMEVSNPGQVTNSEILKSIQSITEVMQQQLNSKTTEQRHCADSQPLSGNDKGTGKKRLGSCITCHTYNLGRSQG